MTILSFSELSLFVSIFPKIPKYMQITIVSGIGSENGITLISDSMVAIPYKIKSIVQVISTIT